MQKLIRRLKYDDDRLVVQDIYPLMALAFEKLVSENPGIAYDDAIIVPIPLHRSREHKRGYNQAFLLAEKLASSKSLAIKTDILRRVRKTKPQFGLNKNDRLSNLKDAFALGSFSVAGKTTILVDDVFTSGSTLTLCAALLTAGGAKHVAAIAAARAPYDK
jgi:ComF family protein